MWESEGKKEKESERERERVKKQLTSNGLSLPPFGGPVGDASSNKMSLDGNKSNGEEVYSANEPVTEY